MVHLFIFLYLDTSVLKRVLNRELEIIEKDADILATLLLYTPPKATLQLNLISYDNAPRIYE
jgi:hypothetical protein